ncbi:MAG: hypothetical protein QOD99_659 [Chthoniobacter sp.]|jgi:hypothetical protein|nr:hypothetical protein [Chthoniobacter sp.]
MTGLLVRLEIAPEKSAVLDVPVAHIFRTMFAHGQQSLLDITENGLPVGSLVLTPKAEADERSLGFSGTLWLRVPGMVKQRMSWEGLVKLDRALRLTGGQFELNVVESRSHLVLTMPKAGESLHCELTQGNARILDTEITVDAAGLARAQKELGFDVSPFLAAQKNVSAPQIVSRQTEHLFHGEKISVFQITIGPPGSALAEIYFSQLGQVLEARTPFGYTLLSQD